jgi:hypothetical protein
VNSKQIVAALSVVALAIIIIYPAVSTGAIIIRLTAVKPENAEHAYVTVNGVWVHQKGQSSIEGWKLVYNLTQTIDLVHPENSSKILPSVQLSVSSYDAIRVQVSDVSWVFNKNNTRLVPEPSQLSAKIEFTVQAGKESTLTLLIGGHREDISGTGAFIGALTVTAS